MKSKFFPKLHRLLYFLNCFTSFFYFTYPYMLKSYGKFCGVLFYGLRILWKNSEKFWNFFKKKNKDIWNRRFMWCFIVLSWNFIKQDWKIMDSFKKIEIFEIHVFSILHHLLLFFYFFLIFWHLFSISPIHTY